MMPEVEKWLVDTVYLINSVFVLSVGVLIGGKVVNCLGGIRELNTVKFMTFLLFMATIFGLIFSFTTDFVPFIILMGFTLFFGAAWLPISMTMNLE